MTQGPISNEVLDERLQNYFDRTMDGLKDVKHELEKLNGRVGKAEARISTVEQHPHETGHAGTLSHFVDFEKRWEELRKEVQVLKDAAVLEAGVRKGRDATLKTGDRIFMLLVAAVPVALAIAAFLRGGN